jgi:HlyD family secretion protein
MNMSSKVLLYSLPSMAGVVAILSVITLARTNIKAAPYTADVRTANIEMENKPSVVSPSCGHVDRIIAAGLVEPSGGIIRLASNSKGIVSRVHVEPGMTVRKGDPVLQLDQLSAEATLDIRKSELAIARARLTSRLAEAIEAQYDVEVVEARLEEKSAKLSDTLLISKMVSRLDSSSFISKRKVQSSQHSVKQATARVRQAKAALNKARNRLLAFSSFKSGHLIRIERANVAKAMAQVKAAQTAIKLLTVLAPSSGMIYQVNIRPGEHTGVDGTPLILMAGHLELNVKVDIYEADFNRFDSSLTAVASRRGSPADRQSLSMVRLFPMVVPKKTLNGRPNEKEDLRVFQVLYRLKGAPFFTGEVVDVFIGGSCSNSPMAAID